MSESTIRPGAIRLTPIASNERDGDMYIAVSMVHGQNIVEVSFDRRVWFVDAGEFRRWAERHLTDAEAIDE